MYSKHVRDIKESPKHKDALSPTKETDGMANGLAETSEPLTSLCSVHLFSAWLASLLEQPAFLLQRDNGEVLGDYCPIASQSTSNSRQGTVDFPHIKNYIRY